MKLGNGLWKFLELKHKMQKLHAIIRKYKLYNNNNNNKTTTL